MIKSVALPSPSASNASLSAILGNEFPRRFGSAVCYSSRSDSSIPKLEPFSRSRLERFMRDPPLIEKSQKELADYCCTLDGDDSYSCWKAYFELKDLEKEYPKEEVERLILQAGGVKSLISCVHGITEIYKSKKEATAPPSQGAEKQEHRRRPFPVPDGIPLTAEELEELEEEEKSARMPDSSYTRLLRARGTHPAWFSPPPDHETD